MTPSDYAAWYGAVVGTAVLAWDYVKWRKSGPQVRAEAFSGWRSFNIEETEGLDLTLVKATNKGDRATTVTSWGLYWYPSGPRLFNKRKRKSFIVRRGLAGTGEIPKRLEPGEVWAGVSKEDEQFKKMLMEGKLYIALGFSHADKEVLVRVKANKALQPTVPASGGHGR
jgi:hypothetical protein